MKIGRFEIKTRKLPKAEYGNCDVCGKPLSKAQAQNKYGFTFRADGMSWSMCKVDMRMCGACSRKYYDKIEKLHEAALKLKYELQDKYPW